MIYNWGDNCEIEQNMNVCAYCHYPILPEGRAERRDVSLMFALQAVCAEKAKSQKV
jgi:hypothetical protein